MLTNVSWADYLSAVSAAVIVYYFFVGMKFYSSDVKQLFAGRRKQSYGMDRERRREFQAEDENDLQSLGGLQDIPAGENSEYQEVEHLIGRVSSVIKEAAERNADPDELKVYLHKVLNEYPGIKKSALRYSVNEYVASECANVGTVQLSEDDVELLWFEKS